MPSMTSRREYSLIRNSAIAFSVPYEVCGSTATSSGTTSGNGPPYTARLLAKTKRGGFFTPRRVRSGAVPPMRNQRLIDACDVLVAFWDGASKGTRNTVERALDSGKEVHVFLGGGGGSPATESRGPQRSPTS